MRRLGFVGVAVLAGCVDSVGPTRDVTGVWRASQGAFGIELDLVQHSDSVTGTGAASGVSTFTIAGTYLPPGLTLTFRTDTTVYAEFVGTVVNDTLLTGIETFVNGADTLTLVRQR